MMTHDDNADDEHERAFEVHPGWVLSARAASEALEAPAGVPSPEADALVGSTIMYNWLTAGWCSGEIVSRNMSQNLIVDGEVANFFVKYACDGPDAPPALHALKAINRVLSTSEVAKADYNSWVLVEPS
jgi:hypothetical protein